MDRMEELVKQLNLYAYYYYVLDNPIVSDKEYDKLYDELVALEEQTGVVLPSSPTLRVGGEILSKFEKYPHKNKLYSLDKAQSKAEMEKWMSEKKKVFPDATFTATYKFDGLTIVCEYNNGTFVKAGTRGNGTVGENVTQQVKTIASVPLEIPYKGHLIVQGEGIVTLSNLKEYNKTAKEKLKNARNAASGGIRNLDPKITKQRKLDVVFYNVNFIDDQKLISTQEDMQAFLKDNKFYTSPYFKVASSYNELEKIVDEVDEQKSKINFLIDGVVININSIKMREAFGFTTKFPKWALAYKFEAMEISTILKDVVWQVGRTGKITPIGIVEPVELAGAVVQRATLNNIEDIAKKKLEIGSRIFIRRSNEVIPEILSLAESLPGAKQIVPPTNCPCCNSELVYKNMNLYCENKTGCSEQIVERLAHFCSKEAMNIEGLSRQTLASFYENFALKEPSELFNLKQDDLLKLKGFKDKKAKNIIESIEKAKKVKFNNFIYALGILNVGTKTAKDLAKQFKNIEELKKATIEDLLEIKDIGEITANAVVEFFKAEENLVQLEKFVSTGVEIVKEEVKEEKSELTGKTVVLTGSINGLTRDEATALLEKYGAIVTSSVSKNTDLVIYGQEAGSKKTKAEALGVKTIPAPEIFGKIVF